MDTIAWFADAVQHHQAGRRQEAERLYRQIVAHDPGHADAWHLLGTLALDAGQPGLACEHMDRAIAFQPHNPVFHKNLALAQQAAGDLARAEASFREALRLKPDYTEASVPLAMLLHGQGRFSAAEVPAGSRVAVAAALHNLGIALDRSGDSCAAANAFRGALALPPDDPEVHTALAMSLLAQGDYAAGWPEYEWRWRCPGQPPQEIPEPRWDGSTLAGKTILLVAEQGLGDTIQFVRFARQLKNPDVRVLLQCQPELLRLMRVCRFLDAVFSREERLPAFDVAAPLMSLPALLGVTLESLPAEVPYLATEPELVAKWRARLATSNPFRIGICWQGGRAARHNPRRAAPLAHFEALARIDSIELVSLQYGFGTEQLKGQSFRVTVLDDDPAASAHDFADTAALLANLDLVVSIDTAVAHLAGALGRPTWVLLPADADWRWLRGRDDSPWYPTMRLFRQPRPDDWESVFRALELALREHLGVLNSDPAARRLP